MSNGINTRRGQAINPKNPIAIEAAIEIIPDEPNVSFPSLSLKAIRSARPLPAGPEKSNSTLRRANKHCH